ncbi:MAG: tetratricopeptide repeat protein [Deltaproteobacteria bacterium]|nr:tetratricopeptide repeat protein [Deltaproteobacteria bacterium]
MSSSKLWPLVLLVACAGPRKIDVPLHLRAETQAQKQTPPAPFVVTLNDGGRAWNVSLPAVSGGYEVRIPVGNAGEALPSAARKSVLLKESLEFKAALARVQALFAKKSYDLALLELAKLRADFPDDPKLLAMEGTIHFKQGHREKAQKAWEEAAALDPENDTVLDMLEGMK